MNALPLLRPLAAVLCLTSAVCALQACSSEDPPAPAVVDAGVSTLTVSPASTSVPRTATRVSYTATLVAPDGGQRPLGVNQVTWASSAENVATIDRATGVAVPVNVGSATITATAPIGDAGALRATATLTVTVPSGIERIVVTPPSAVIPVGGTQQYKAVAYLFDGGQQELTTAVFSTSALSVATIEQSGLARGVSAGSAIIKAEVGQVTSQGVTLEVTPRPDAGPGDAGSDAAPRDAAMDAPADVRND